MQNHSAVTSRRFLAAIIDQFTPSEIRESDLMMRLLTPIDEDEAQHQIDEICELLGLLESDFWLMYLPRPRSARVKLEANFTPILEIDVVVVLLAQRWRHCNWPLFEESERLRRALAHEEATVLESPDEIWFDDQWLHVQDPDS